MVPWCIFLSDLIGALAAGMTLKFFSLFFYEKCGMGPVYISALSVASPLIISLMSQWAKMVSRGVRGCECV